MCVCGFSTAPIVRQNRRGISPPHDRSHHGRVVDLARRKVTLLCPGPSYPLSAAHPVKAPSSIHSVRAREDFYYWLLLEIQVPPQMEDENGDCDAAGGAGIGDVAAEGDGENSEDAEED